MMLDLEDPKCPDCGGPMILYSEIWFCPDCTTKRERKHDENSKKLRPSKIVEMFWKSLLVIEEKAVFLDPAYIIVTKPKGG